MWRPRLNIGGGGVRPLRPGPRINNIGGRGKPGASQLQPTTAAAAPVSEEPAPLPADLSDQPELQQVMHTCLTSISVNCWPRLQVVSYQNIEPADLHSLYKPITRLIVDRATKYQWAKNVGYYRLNPILEADL